MKKFFILGLLIAPIAAHATDPVGPSAVPSGETAVLATSPGPYAVAEVLPDDLTQVVSASYVKGAYNDTIAAVNKVRQTATSASGLAVQAINNKVDKEDFNNFENVISDVFNDIKDQLNDTNDRMTAFIDNTNYRIDTTAANLDAHLIEQVGQLRDYTDSKRVNAVTTWGSDNVSQLELANLPAGN